MSGRLVVEVVFYSEFTLPFSKIITHTTCEATSMSSPTCTTETALFDMDGPSTDYIAANEKLSTDQSLDATDATSAKRIIYKLERYPKIEDHELNGEVTCFKKPHLGFADTYATIGAARHLTRHRLSRQPLQLL